MEIRFRYVGVASCLKTDSNFQLSECVYIICWTFLVTTLRTVLPIELYLGMNETMTKNGGRFESAPFLPTATYSYQTIFVHFNRLTSNLMNSVLRVPLAGHFRFFPIQNPLFCLLVESNASIESVYAQVSTSFNIVEPSAASKSSERHIESRKT